MSALASTNRRKQATSQSRLGYLLLQKGFINRYQLNDALKLQAETGQLLGEVLLAQGLLTQRQLHKVLKRQSRYRLIAPFLAMLLAPLGLTSSWAGSLSTATPVSDNVSPTLNLKTSHTVKPAEKASPDHLAATTMAPLSDEEMSVVHGQALASESFINLDGKVATQDATANLSNPLLTEGIVQEAVEMDLLTAFDQLLKETRGEREDELGVLNELGTLLLPIRQFLDADVTVTGVTYDHRPRRVVNHDGNVNLTLPQEIEEIAFRNMRVKGDQSLATFGDLIIQGIRFSPNSNITIRVHE